MKPQSANFPNQAARTRRGCPAVQKEGNGKINWLRKDNLLFLPSWPATPPPTCASVWATSFFSAASLFEAWVTRRKSAHTQRAYREDVMSFVRFAGIDWPDRKRGPEVRPALA